MSVVSPLRDRRGRAYTPAVGPRLKTLLGVIFATVALLGANSVYLVAITVLGEEYQNQFYMFMFLLHLMLGLALLLPFLIFAFGHLATAYNRPNRRAVRAGVALLSLSLVLVFSGFVLMRFGVGEFKFEVRDPALRSVAYWAHVITPLLAILFYVIHRMAGPIIKWRWAWAWAGSVAVFVLAMAYLHHQDPRVWYAIGPKQGMKYFAPSSARTATGNFIPATTLMMDQYCQKCHADAYEQHYQSVHHFSSFNNQPYLFSVSETRQVALRRDGSVQASRWCAGCHDPVPFFSGMFDDPNYDIKNSSDPTTQAGITCTTCHAITNINSVTGNADYTIDEPVHYPFAYSDNLILQWINNQLVKAKPALHKKTFLKPFHRSEEFCSTCHKVSLPMAVTHYKDWLRGQDHYTGFLVSGQSGHGARSFYYPDKAKDRCADCHMPLIASNDFGAGHFDATGTRKIHNHFFLGANTGLPALRNYQLLLKAGTGATPDQLDPVSQAAYRWNESIIHADQQFLRDDQMRLDIFALRTGGTIEGELIAPLRPQVPTLKPGDKYLLEVVLRTLKLGHPFTQGTVDSNEVWVELEARSGHRILGHSGALDEQGTVDPWSHFVNALVIDQKGNRIDRRNPQDIYVNVYNHQIPPGAGQVVHYLLEIPPDVHEPIQISARLNYRKFDRRYMEHVSQAEGVPAPNLPVTTMCEDTLFLPVEGHETNVGNAVVKIPEWQRWNDYGIGLFLEGEQSTGSEKGELRQAEQVFQKVVELGQGEGYANLARIYVREKRLADAIKALQAAAQNTDMVPFATAGAGPGEVPGIAEHYVKPAAPWVVAWVTGLVNEQNGQLDEAIQNFELILSDQMRAGVANRGFDFRRDYVVWNELGVARFERAEQERGPRRAEERGRRIREATDAFEHALTIEPEDLTAHYNLALLYGILAESSAETPMAEKSIDPTPEQVSAADLRQLARQLTSSQADGKSAAATARKLAHWIGVFSTSQRDPSESRLSTLLELLDQVRSVYRRTWSDPALAQATAEILQVLHSRLHLIYKPDDNARSAVALHRKNNPPANHAAQSIVIYPLNRTGASRLTSNQSSSIMNQPEGE